MNEILGFFLKGSIYHKTKLRWIRGYGLKEKNIYLGADLRIKIKHCKIINIS